MLGSPSYTHTCPSEGEAEEIWQMEDEEAMWPGRDGSGVAMWQWMGAVTGTRKSHGMDGPLESPEGAQ